MADNTFELKIITPERKFYDEQVTMVEFNTSEGEIGIYKNHVPTTVIIKPGILRITNGDEQKVAALHAGFVEILGDKVTVLAEVIEWPEEIDLDRLVAQLCMMEDPDKRIGAVNHLYGVSLAATMIAKKRGEDPELAAEAVKKARAEGMKEVYAFTLPDYGPEDCGARWHPNAEYNRRAGLLLADFLKGIFSVPSLTE